MIRILKYKKNFDTLIINPIKKYKPVDYLLITRAVINNNGKNHLALNTLISIVS